MISNELLSDDRIHLNADETLSPVPHNKPKPLFPTKTDTLIMELTATDEQKKLTKKAKGEAMLCPPLFKSAPDFK